MKCPHCLIHLHPDFKETFINGDQWVGYEHKGETYWKVQHMECPACRNAILVLYKKRSTSRWESTIINPINANRPPASAEIPQDLADDFNEAGSVLHLSPKASAALSRRCLQHLLNLQGFKQHNLSKAIEDAITKLPTHLATNLDAVRNIGNFAAHPTKDTNFDAIVDVEPEEAEWNLEVLEGLFDYYYVQPTKDQARRNLLNEKLVAAGKPPMKESTKINTVKQD